MDRDGEEGPMRGHTIRRATSIVAGAVLMVGVGLAPGVARASGGGGCGRAVTDDDGTRIGISNFCFDPTIFRVQPGETVTWVNKDGFPHTVLGANGSWGGFDFIRRNGGEVSYRFVSSGVYPYVCTIHVGMVGAVVVGDGKADAGSYAVTTNAGPVTLAQSPVAGSGAAIDQNVVPAAVPARSWPGEVWWGMGLLLVVVAAIASSRRRRAHGTGTH
jgi:plastocyanin